MTNPKKVRADTDSDNPTDQHSRSSEDDIGGGTPELAGEMAEGRAGRPEEDVTLSIEEPVGELDAQDGLVDTGVTTQEVTAGQGGSRALPTSTKRLSIVRDKMYEGLSWFRRHVGWVPFWVTVAAIAVAVLVLGISVEPPDDLFVVLSLIWSVLAFFLSRSATREQRERDNDRAERMEARERARERRQEERQSARDQRREARETEREERREKRAKERARGEVVATIATHVADINAHLTKIDILAKPIMSDKEMRDNLRCTIRVPEAIRPFVDVQHR